MVLRIWMNRLDLAQELYALLSQGLLKKSDKIQTFIHLHWNKMTTISSCLNHAGNRLIFFSLQYRSTLQCAWTRHLSCWHILFQLLLWQIVSAIVQLKCCRSLFIMNFKLFFEDSFKSKSKRVLQNSVNHRQVNAYRGTKQSQGGSQSSWIYRLCPVSLQCSAQ